MHENYVSIVLPTYNRSDAIRKSIESIQRQTYKLWELLVIDDGSSDDTEKIVTSAAVADARIRYYRQPCNRGVAAARNEGIRNSRYEYIAFQDSDDIWKADKLEKQMRIFAQKPEVGMVYCPYEGTRSDGSKVIIPDVTKEPNGLEGQMYVRLLLGNVIGGPTAVIRRKCLEECRIQEQYFDENLTCLEDWELFLRITRNFEIGFVSEPLLVADIHEGGVSSRVGGYFHARCIMVARHKETLLQYGIFNQVVEQILNMAKQAGILEQVAKLLEHCLGGMDDKSK